MGIIRLITVAAVIWLAWFFFKRFQRYAEEKKQIPKKEEPISSVKKCAVCGVYVPEHEAFERNDRYYCSRAHENADL